MAWSLRTRVLVAAATLLSAAAPALGQDDYDPALAQRAFHFSAVTYCSEDNVEAWTCGECDKDDLKGFELKSVIEEVGTNLAITGYDATNNQIVVAFRGSYSIDTWILDFDFTWTNLVGVDCGFVHSGFHDSWHQALAQWVMEDVAAILDEHPDAGVLLTGHSLGAALSYMAFFDVSAHFKSVGAPGKITVITFGAPRWGDDNVIAAFENSVDLHFRIVHRCDLVVVVPFAAWDFRHAGPVIWYTNPFDGDEYRRCEDGEDSYCLNTDNLGICLLPNIVDHVFYMNEDYICLQGLLSDPLDLDMNGLPDWEDEHEPDCVPTPSPTQPPTRTPAPTTAIPPTAAAKPKSNESAQRGLLLPLLLLVAGVGLEA